MHNSVTLGMPTDFPKRVHLTLRTWHDPREKRALDHLVLAHSVAEAQQNVTMRGISNQILLSGLGRLRDFEAEDYEILQRRFPNNETAHALAFRLNLSEDVIFQRQRVAFADLAAIIWDQELEARRQQAERLQARFQPPTYTRLFGIGANLAEARVRLEPASEPWILSFEGMGGIDKTALADALVRETAAGIRFRDIAWVSIWNRPAINMGQPWRYRSWADSMRGLAEASPPRSHRRGRSGSAAGRPRRRANGGNSPGTPGALAGAQGAVF
jgi:hypothetical protein